MSHQLNLPWNLRSSKRKNESCALPSKPSKKQRFPTTNLVGGLGQNDFGQLAFGTNTIDSKLMLAPLLRHHDIVDVVCGSLHCVALTASGKVLSWGLKDDGILGRDDDNDNAIPKPVTGFNGNKIVAIAAGESFTLCLDVAGNVYGFGVLRDSQGKQVNVVGGTTPANHVPIHIHVEGKVKSIFAGGNSFALVLDDDQTLLTGGICTDGRLGRTTTQSEQNLHDATFSHPTKANWSRSQEGMCIEDVSIGGGYILVIGKNKKEKTSLLSAGLGSCGQLGHGDGEDRAEFEEVVVLNDYKLVQVAAGQFHSVVLTDQGEVFAFGKNTDGQCGIPGNATYFLPVKVPLSDHIIHIAAGENHSFFQTKHGKIFACGFNEYGQTGLVGEGEVLSPTAVDLSSITIGYRLPEVLQLSAGSQHTLLLMQVQESEEVVSEMYANSQAEIDALIQASPQEEEEEEEAADNEEEEVAANDEEEVEGETEADDEEEAATDSVNNENSATDIFSPAYLTSRWKCKGCLNSLPIGERCMNCE